MKAIKAFVFTALFVLSSLAFAQGDDWQIGGGGSAGRISREIYNEHNPRTGTIASWGDSYDPEDFGFVFGYVSKQWTNNYNGETRNENLWSEEGKRFHGIQIGIQATPHFTPWFGLKTGLYYEVYLSSSDKIYEYHGWDKVEENDLYIPAQLMFSIPFTSKTSLSFFGGIGFQWAINGKFREDGHEYYDYYGHSHYVGPEGRMKFGDGWPKHVNWQAEAGLNLRFDVVQLGFTYSYGLTNHHIVSEETGLTASKSRQDKIAINLGIVF